MQFAVAMKSAGLFAAVLVAAACAEKAPPSPPTTGEFVVETTAPEPGSMRARALAAIDSAHDFKLYSLQPFLPPSPPPPSAEQSNAGDGGKELQTAYDDYEAKCAKGGCLQNNRILGEIDIDGNHEREALKGFLRKALDDVPNYGLACAAQFRHAIGFRSGESDYHVLLCYECGQIAVAVDGESRGQEQTSQMLGEPELDAILARANIPLAAKP